MGSRSRYGKYGESKRFARLQKAKTGPNSIGGGVESSRRPVQRINRRVPENRIRIIPATPNDADFIRRLSKQVFSRYGRYDDTLARWFLSGMTVTILASKERNPVGFAMLGRCGRDEPFSRVYELLAIAVEPKMQKLGIGNLLMKAIEAKARELPAEVMVLHTAADNIIARKLFKKHGFIISQTKNRFYPEGQDALMMYREFK